MVDYPRVNSTPIETYGVIADFDAGNGRYTVWSNFQGPYAMHPLVCDALRVRGHQLRLISSPSSGGSFGIKHGVYPYIVLIGLAARKVGRPVKWIEDRIEHLAASSAATGRATHIDGAFNENGRLLALRLKQIENVGAYLRPPDPASLYRMHSTLSGPYRVRHIAVENKVVVTNQVPSGLNRGFGGPQFYYPLERMMDLAAKEDRYRPESSYAFATLCKPFRTKRRQGLFWKAATIAVASNWRSSGQGTRIWWRKEKARVKKGECSALAWHWRSRRRRPTWPMSISR